LPPDYAVRNKFLVLNIHKVTIGFSLSFASFVNAATRNSLSFKIIQYFSKKEILLTNFLIILALSIITRNYYTKLCTIPWSSYHGSSAKLLQ